jgi:hypothetical protein
MDRKQPSRRRVVGVRDRNAITTETGNTICERSEHTGTGRPSAFSISFSAAFAISAVAAILALLTACALIDPIPTLPTPVRPPDLHSTADALQAAVEGNYPLDALAIRYEGGSESWDGKTTLTIHGSGAVAVTSDHTGQHSAWSSSLTEEEFLALVRLLVDHEVWAIQGEREIGVPDEAHPTVTVEAEGFEPLQVGMWLGEAREHPDFRPILDVLAGLARDVSGGGAR